MSVYSPIRNLLGLKRRGPKSKRKRMELSFEALEDRLTPSTLTVNTLNGAGVAGDGLVTLAEAVAAANGDTTTDLGETGSGADTIVFDPSLFVNGPGTIQLGGSTDTVFGPTALLIDSDITITGPAGNNGLTLQRAFADNLRLFRVTANGALTLENLTLAGGVAQGGDGEAGAAGGGGGAGLGGAVFNSGTLNIIGSTLTGNVAQGGNGGPGFIGTGNGGAGGGPNGGAGGALDAGTGGFGGGGGGAGHQVLNSGIAGNGGFGGGGGGGGTFGGTGGFAGGNGGNGDFAGSANSGGGGGAGLGGAIFNDGGTLTISNSTFSGNQAVGGAGGDGAAGLEQFRGEDGRSLGGAIFNRDGSVTINNSTITDNSADEGGGVASPDGAVTLNNTILAGNSAAPLQPVDVSAASLTAANSLIGVNLGTDLQESLTPSPEGNLVGTVDGPIDAELAALADNGGPTQTHALLITSPAINLGSNPDSLTNDQRGMSRVSGTQADIGAFERQLPSPDQLVVTTADDELDLDFDAADLSLREAIFFADFLVGHNSITFAPELSGQAINLTLGELVVADSVTITGLGADQSIIDAQLQSRIFNILETAGDVTLDGLTLTGGRAMDDGTSTDLRDIAGGAIRFVSSGVLTIRNSIVTGNSSAGSDGGGIFSAGDLILIGSTVSQNSTSGDGAVGGGIFAVGDVDLTDSIVSGNHTSGRGSQGGGIFAEGDVTLTDSAVSDNHTSGQGAQGGGIFAEGDVTFINSNVSDNHTEGENADGGGLFAEGDVTLTDSSVAQNFTTGNNAAGGGIFAEGDVTLTEGAVAQNSTAGLFGFGGGLFARGAVTLTDSTVAQNSTAGIAASGGGIHGESIVTAAGSTIAHNSTAGMTALGGGIFAVDDVTLTNSTVAQNSTAGDFSSGAGIFGAAGVDLINSTLFDNTTSGNHADGGGIYSAAAVTLTDSTVAGNSTTGESAEGGGIYVFGEALLINSTVSGNSTTGANSHGGGLFIRDEVGILNSTIFNNSTQGAGAVGGGIFVMDAPDAELGIFSSIVAGNRTADRSSPDIHIGANPLVVANSLIGSNDGTGFSPAPVGSPDADGNLIGDGGATIDPRLTSLSLLGGSTPVHGLLSDSPALDGGSNLFDLDFDQRGEGFDRTQGLATDIGAFEGTVVAFPLVVTTADDELDTVFDPADLSLREAIAAANLLGGHDIITFASNLSGQPIVLTLGELVITDTVTITGLGADQTIVDAQQQSRIFNILQTAGDVTLDGLTLTGGRTTGNNANQSDSTFSGGAIRFVSPGVLTIQDSIVTNNFTEGSRAMGGGIFAEGDVAVTGSIISQNSTMGTISPGGGIYANGDVTVIDSSISQNVTVAGSADGGGIYAVGDVTVTNSTVSQNVTTRDSGGGIFAEGDVTVTGSTVSNNSAHTTGGGIVAASDLTVTDSLVSENTAGIGAGGVFAGGNVTVTDSVFSHNFTTRDSGGAITALGDVTVTGSTISDNFATNGNGGGIFAVGDVTVTNSAVLRNSSTGDSQSGGGIHAVGDVTVTNSTVSLNSTTGNMAAGGGIFSEGAVTVTNSTISENFTNGDDAFGGGIFARGNVTLTSSTVYSNVTEGMDAQGGGVVSSGSLVIENSIVASNRDDGANPDLFSQAGVTARFSLIGDNTGTNLRATTPGFPDLDGNFIGSAGNPIDPRLAPLADNGGPTPTHALFLDSPAFNTGDRSLADTPDQRGILRDATPDIGAFEANFGLSVDDVEIVENDQGVTNALFTISIGNPETINPLYVNIPVQVDYLTLPRTAQGLDFVNTTGTVTFQPGQTSRSIIVPILGDTLEEGDETFFVQLFNNIGAPLGDAVGAGTILDNDDPQIESVRQESVDITGLANEFNFYIDSRGLYENLLGGNEKWLRGDVNQFGTAWYFLLPNGDLFAYDGSGQLTGALLAALGTNAWENLELVVNASTLTAANPSEVQAADQARAFYRSSAGNFYFDLYGGGEKWIKGLISAKSPANQNNPWYYILSDGSVYEWDGTSGALSGTRVNEITADPNLYEGPSLLYDAFQDDFVNSGGFDQLRNFYFDRSGGLVRNLYENHFGADEKWFRGDVHQFGNPWYILLPNGDLLEWDGSQAATGNVLANLGPNAWNNIERVVRDYTPALAEVDRQNLITLDRNLGLFRASNDMDYFFNALGQNERLLRGNANSFGSPYYLILPDGRFFEWDGTLSATLRLIDTLPVEVYADPLLLADAYADGSVWNNIEGLEPFEDNNGGPGDRLVQ